MSAGESYLKANKTVVTCTKCNHQCLPWQVGSSYDEARRTKCTECNEIGCAIYHEDEKLALDIYNKTINRRLK